MTRGCLCKYSHRIQPSVCPLLSRGCSLIISPMSTSSSRSAAFIVLCLLSLAACTPPAQYQAPAAKPAPAPAASKTATPPSKNAKVTGNVLKANLAKKKKSTPATPTVPQAPAPTDKTQTNKTNNTGMDLHTLPTSCHILTPSYPLCNVDGSPCRGVCVWAPMQISGLNTGGVKCLLSNWKQQLLSICNPDVFIGIRCDVLAATDCKNHSVPANIQSQIDSGHQVCVKVKGPNGAIKYTGMEPTATACH